MVSDPLLLVGALVLVLVLTILARRLSRKSTPALPGEQLAAPTAAPVADDHTPTPFLAAADGDADDLSRIKGIGPRLSARLAELGVFHYRQIAGWTPAQLALVDRELGQFQGRPERDQWQAQAKLLAEGDVKAFERSHGKLSARPANPGGSA